MDVHTTNIAYVNDDEHHYPTYESVSDWLNEWDFAGFETKTYTHRIHNYPAVFIPQLVRKLILEYSKPGDAVLDIFNGSGTTSLEAMLTGRGGYGIELNPLATLLAKVKTTPIEDSEIQKAFRKVQKDVENTKFEHSIATYKNVNFWYHETVVAYVSKLVAAIQGLKKQDVREFFLITLSKILREVSYCNHSGFKMHRDKKKIDKPPLSASQIWDLFVKKYNENVASMARLNSFLERQSSGTLVKPVIIRGSSMEKQPQLKNDSIDLIVTSPPYGDSSTTVAYGQFSRLSSQWLGLDTDEAIIQLDSNLLGGKTTGINLDDEILQRSITLRSAVMAFQNLIENSDTSLNRKKNTIRLKDVISFYRDLDKTIEVNAKYLKQGGSFVLVTASRVVKGIKLNTDQIIAELSLSYSLEPKGIMFRDIINKRMPRSVSATNIKGEIAPTMTTENIVILKKL